MVYNANIPPLFHLFLMPIPSLSNPYPKPAGRQLNKLLSYKIINKACTAKKGFRHIMMIIGNFSFF